MSPHHGPLPPVPLWPRWVEEATPCTTEGCTGRRYAWRPLDGSPGLDTRADWNLCQPQRRLLSAADLATLEAETVAGEWWCPECATRGPIPLSEVLESPTHALHSAGPLGALLAGG